MLINLSLQGVTKKWFLFLQYNYIVKQKVDESKERDQPGHNIPWLILLL